MTSNPFEFRKLLSGKIEYESINKPDINHFKAIIKLKKHPNWEQITSNNFIPRGSKLRYTDWIYGMVVYVGQETKFYLRQNVKSKHNVSPKFWNYEELKQYKFLLSLYGLMIIFFIINIIISTSHSYIENDPFKNNLNENSLISENIKIDFFRMISMIPIYYFLVIDIVNFLFILQGKQALNNSQIVEPESQNIQIMSDPIKLTELSQTSHVFFNKNLSMTTGKLNVRSIGLGNNFVYQFKDYDAIKTYVEENSHNFIKMKSIVEMQFKSYFNEHSETEEEQEIDDALQNTQRNSSTSKERKQSQNKQLLQKPYIETKTKNLLSSVNLNAAQNTIQSMLINQLKLGFDSSNSNTTNNEIQKMSSINVGSKQETIQVIQGTFGVIQVFPSQNKIIEQSDELELDLSSKKFDRTNKRGNSVNDSFKRQQHQRKPRMSQTCVKPKNQANTLKINSDQNSTRKSLQEQISANGLQYQDKNQAQTGNSLTQNDIQSIEININSNRNIVFQSKQTEQITSKIGDTLFVETPKESKPLLLTITNSDNKSPLQQNGSAQELNDNDRSPQNVNGNHFRLNIFSVQNDIDKMNQTTSQNTLSNYNHFNITNEEIDPQKIKSNNNNFSQNINKVTQNNFSENIYTDDAQNQSLIKANNNLNDQQDLKKLYQRSFTSNQTFQQRNQNSLNSGNQYTNKEERFFSPFKKQVQIKNSGKSPILIPQIFNSAEMINNRKKTSSNNQAVSIRQKRSMVLHDANYEENKNEIDYLDSLFHPDDHIHNEILIAMCLCQMTRSRYDQDRNSLINLHQQPEEEAINEFISNFNVFLKCRSDDYDCSKYVVQFFNFYSNYQILALMEPSKNRKRFSILVRDPNASEIEISSILYVRQELEGTKSIPNNFNLTISQKQQVESTITNMLLRGNQVIIYGKREFTETQTCSIISSYKNIYNNVVVDEDILENLFEQIENELDFLCLVGLEEELHPDVKETVQMLEKRKVKLNLYSDDRINKALPLGFNIGLLPSMVKLTFLTQSDPESIKYDIKEQIKEITLNLKDGQNNSALKKRISVGSSNINRKTLSNRRISVYNMTKQDYQKNFMIIVSKQSLKVILNIILLISFINLQKEDDFLKQHFAFIYYFSKGLIGCELTNEQKSEIYSLIRMMCQEECKIISIGEENFDTNADLNIETRQTYITDCHVRVFSFKGLQELFFYTSRLLQETYDLILMFTMNRSLVIGIIWLVLRPTQQDDIFQTYIQTIFYHLLFYLVGVSNIISDKCCIGWLTQFYNKSCQSTNQIVQIQEENQTEVPLNPINQKTMLSLYQTTKDLILKNEQDFHIIASSLQFRCNQVILQQALLFKKFIVTCLISSIFEVAIILLTLYFYGPLSSVSGKILPSTIQVKAIFLVTNWVGQMRIMINSQLYNLRQFLIQFIFLFGISLLYIFVDIDGQDQVNVNEAWGSPELWFLIISILIIQLLFIIFIQYIELQFYVGMDLFIDITQRKLMEILSYAQNLRAITIRKVDASQFNLMIFIKKLFSNVDMDLTIQQLLNPENSLVNNTKINRFTLSFINNDAQKHFEEEEYSQSILYTKRSFIIFIIVQGFFLIQFHDKIFERITYSGSNTDDNEILIQRVYMILYLCLVGFILIMQGYFLAMFNEAKNSGQFNGTLFRMHMLKIILYVEIIIICQNEEFLMLYILLLYSNIHFIIIPFQLVFLSNLGLTIVYLTFKFKNLLNNQEYFQLLFQPFMAITYFTFAISQKYVYYRRQKKNYIQQYELNVQNKKINDVLEILLPKFIINRIKSNDPNKPFRFQEKQGNASIIFCDICHFDDIIKEKNEKIIPFLDKVFKTFDKFCARSGLQKIETVGKTYMASAGLKDFEDQVDSREREVDPVERAANLALDMIEYVKDLKWSQNGQNLELKIGIHYGQVIAGVIGHHKPQFSLIGDTVNTTSRVCSKGNPSEITLSEEAYNKIKGKVNKFYFSDPKIVFAKGKGEITLYTLKKFNPAIHKKKLAAIKSQKAKEEKEILPINIQTTTIPKEVKKRTAKRSLTSKYNPPSNSGNLKKSSNLNNLKIEQIEEANEINSPEKIKMNTLIPDYNQNLAIPSNHQNKFLQANMETNIETRNKSHTNEALQFFISRSRSKIELDTFAQIKNEEENTISPSSPYKKSKHFSSFHKNHFKNNNQNENLNISNPNQPNKMHTEQQIQTRHKRAESIKLATSPLKENDEESPPVVVHVNKRSLNIPSISPNLINNNKKKKPILMHSGTFYIPTSPNPYQQQQQQLQQQLINSQIIQSRQLLTGSGIVKQKNSNLNGGNSILMSESFHNFKEYAYGNPYRGSGMQIQQNSANNNTILQQIASNCKEDIVVKYLESYQEKYMFEFSRAQQFLNNDKEEEQKQLEGEFQQLSLYNAIFKQGYQDKVDEFYSNIVESSQSSHLQMFGLSLFVCILKTIGLVIILTNEDFNKQEIGINIGFRCLVITFICIFMVKKQYIIQSDLFEQYQLAGALSCILFIILITISLYEIIAYSESLVQIQYIEQIFYFAIFNNISFVKLYHRVFFIIFLTFSIIFGQSMSGTHYFSTYYFFFSCCFLYILKYYMILSLLIQNYNTMRILDSKKQQKDSLVKNLIPKHLLEYFNVKSASDLCDVFEDATLLFADITDFTKYCALRNPEEVVNMLSNLFLKFDMKCQELKCFKVYTIGDCYVVLGVDNAKDRNPAQEANNVVKMAFNMLEIIKIVRKEVEFETLNMRIGIHTGQIIGGITGSDIVRYDIYGTDVMISNKMESNGEPGKIMVSETTKNLLESAYESEYKFEIGNAVQDIQGYFIQKRSESESNLQMIQHIHHNQYILGDVNKYMTNEMSPLSSENQNQNNNNQNNVYGDEIIGDDQKLNGLDIIKKHESEVNSNNQNKSF